MARLVEREMTAPQAETAGEIAGVPMVPWDQFAPRFDWRQGEHVGLIGPTGSGKTNAAFWLLPMRRFVTILATKPRDSSLEKFGKRNGYKKIERWEKLSHTKYPRRILWPNARALDAQAVQQKAFAEALGIIYRQGGWCVYMDELWFIGQVLNLTRTVKIYLQQARSMGISLVVSSQRPAWIPVEVFDQSTHLFFYRDNDERNLSRIAGIGYLNANTIRTVVASLPEYHVLYVNTRTGTMMITKMPPPQE